MKNSYQNHSAGYSPKWSSWLIVVSILSILFYIFTVVLLHFLDTSVDPLTHGVSYYALGPYGFLMTVSFIFLGMGGLALTVSLYLTEPVYARSRVGLFFLGLWSVTTILAGIFSLDAEGTPQTTSGVIHSLAGMNFLFIAAASVMISRRLRIDPRWEGASQIALWIAFAVIIASVLLFVLMGMLQPLGIGGVAQRIYWLAVLIWLLFVAIRLRKIAANQ